MAPEIGNEEIVRYTVKEILADIRHEIIGVREDVRDRYHKLAGAIEGLDKRVTRTELVIDTYEEIRRVREPQFDALLKGTAMREAVEDAMASREERGFSRREKIVGLCIAFAILLLTLLSVLHIHL